MSWASRCHSLHNTLRHEVGSLPIGGGVGGGRNLSGEGGKGARMGVAGEGGGGSAAVPDGEEVEGICNGDLDVGDVVAMVVPTSMGMERGVYRRWGRVLNHLPQHTPPSIV
jgi:hypothetical protein